MQRWSLTDGSWDIFFYQVTFGPVWIFCSSPFCFKFAFFSLPDVWLWALESEAFIVVLRGKVKLGPPPQKEVHFSRSLFCHYFASFFDLHV